jgi:glutathione S-transferase
MMTRTQPHLILCELTDPGLPGVESYSPYCLKAHRALRAAGLPYERRCAYRPDAHRAWNPTGQVPVLLIDAEPVADSTRILQRIDALTGVFSHALTPDQRAEAWLWEEFADTAMGPHLASARWADDRNWPLTRDALFASAPWFVRKIIVPQLRKNMLRGLVARDLLRRGWPACWERYLALLDQLEARAPEQGFWIGDSLSVADIGLFGPLHGLRTPLTVPQADELARRSKLTAYLDRVHAATHLQLTAEPAPRLAHSA